jgi:hypothetical protein
LTTFQPPSSTYKPIPVPLPAVGPGEKWRLGLFAGPPSRFVGTGSSATRNAAGHINVTLLELLDEDPPILGVWSEPINILPGVGTLGGPIVNPARKRAKVDSGSNGRGESSASASASANGSHDKGKGKAKASKEKDKDEGSKQTRIQREWLLDGMPTRNGSAPSAPTEGGLAEEAETRLTLKIIEQTSFDLDKVCESSPCLAVTPCCMFARWHRLTDRKYGTLA